MTIPPGLCDSINYPYISKYSVNRCACCSASALFSVLDKEAFCVKKWLYTTTMLTALALAGCSNQNEQAPLQQEPTTNVAGDSEMTNSSETDFEIANEAISLYEKALTQVTSFTDYAGAYTNHQSIRYSDDEFARSDTMTIGEYAASKAQKFYHVTSNSTYTFEDEEISEVLEYYNVDDEMYLFDMESDAWWSEVEEVMYYRLPLHIQEASPQLFASYIEAKDFATVNIVEDDTSYYLELPLSEETHTGFLYNLFGGSTIGAASETISTFPENVSFSDMKYIVKINKTTNDFENFEFSFTYEGWDRDIQMIITHNSSYDFTRDVGEESLFFPEEIRAVAEPFPI